MLFIPINVCVAELSILAEFECGMVPPKFPEIPLLPLFRGTEPWLVWSVSVFAVLRRPWPVEARLRPSTVHIQYSSRLKSESSFSAPRAGKSRSGSPSPASCVYAFNYLSGRRLQKD